MPDLSFKDLASREALVEWLRSGGPHISVGLMAADAMAYGKAITELEEAGVSLLHFDIMDGVFCPQMTAGPGLVKASKTAMLKDVHLMVADPLAQIPAHLAAGADIVHVHAEGMLHLHRALVALDVPVAGCESGRKVLRSVALNPGTPVSILKPLLRSLEMVTFIAVDPGWSGGAPDVVVADKIAELKVMAGEQGVDPLVAIDGGITISTFPVARAMGAHVIVSGSATFKAGATVKQNLTAMLEAPGN
ncbi:ribulose-phosphate 3-epimerase [uncultured Cohaesibacter sp.]|uniref:ribulose-phosphate 3-epimerase n=1 Tax=uncultured Cohaesibacter sp. TaxID=1002546 RepID=UPI0029C73F3D|nr:ribulose-phosphate 3-epimerase [uncultured Cohaesibacter sp.]